MFADAEERIVVSGAPYTSELIFCDAVSNRIDANLAAVDVSPCENEAHEICLIELKQVLGAKAEVLKAHGYSVVVVAVHWQQVRFGRRFAVEGGKGVWIGRASGEVTRI